jgi:hypothetical protein
MDAQDRLSKALGLKYDVIVHEKDGGFIFFIRELGLRHAAASLEAGYAEMQEMKDKWIRDLAAEGLWDWIVEPGERPAQIAEAVPGRLQSLLPFFIKLLCVSFLLLVVVAFVSKGGREVGYGLEKKLDSIVTMRPEQIEAHREKAHAIAGKLRPIVLEIMGAFQAEPLGPVPPSGQENATSPSVPHGPASAGKP